MLLFLAIALNSVLHAADLCNSDLLVEFTSCVDEVIILALEAAKYWPLGASVIPLGMIVV